MISEETFDSVFIDWETKIQDQLYLLNNICPYGLFKQDLRGLFVY